MGYKIRNLRLAKGMTQEELAKKSGVSRGTICALENGVNKTTSTKTLLALARALDTTVKDLFFEISV